jgi:hypothetical protein
MGTIAYPPAGSSRALRGLPSVGKPLTTHRMDRLFIDPPRDDRPTEGKQPLPYPQKESDEAKPATL